MGFFGKITGAYKSLFGKNGERDGDFDGSTEEIDAIGAFEGMEEDTVDEQTALLMQLNPEMRKFVMDSSKNEGKSTKVQPKIVPITILSDQSTATDAITLLGMVRWALERAASDSSGTMSFDFKVTCRNRSQSPFLVSIGDVAVEPIPVQCEIQVGN